MVIVVSLFAGWSVLTKPQERDAMTSHWAGFLKRRWASTQRAKGAFAPISDHQERRAGVRFEALQYEDGQPFVALVFMKDGKPLPLSGRLFTFDLQPGTTKGEAEKLVSLLNDRVTDFVETRASQP